MDAYHDHERAALFDFGRYFLRDLDINQSVSNTQTISMYRHCRANLLSAAVLHWKYFQLKVKEKCYLLENNQVLLLW